MPTSLNSPISTSSPVVEVVMNRKRKLKVMEEKWKWGVANFIAALLLILEAHSASCHILAQENSAWRSIISHIESVVILILFTNAALDWYNHFFPLGISGDTSINVALSPAQRKLLGIKENEYGFKTKTPAKNENKIRHPYGFSDPLNGSFLSPKSNALFSGSLNMSSMNASSLDSSSWIYQPGHGDKTVSPMITNAEPKCSPSLNGTFTDEKSLRDYLREYEEKEKSFGLTSTTSPSGMYCILIFKLYRMVH